MTRHVEEHTITVDLPKRGLDVSTNPYWLTLRSTGGSAQEALAVFEQLSEKLNADLEEARAECGAS